MWKSLCDGLEDEFQKGTTPLRRNGEPPIKRVRRDYKEKIEEEEENDHPFKWFNRQREVSSHYIILLVVRSIIKTELQALEEMNRVSGRARIFTEEDTKIGNGE